MPNYTWQLQDCKIFEFMNKQTKAYGKMVWSDGTEPHEQRFETKSQQVMDVIELNRSAEASFRVSGTMTLNHGYGDHKGKTFKNHVITEIERI